MRLLSRTERQIKSQPIASILHMGVSPHSEAARTGAISSVGIRANRGESEFHKHAVSRTPTANQTKKKHMKAMRKKHLLGAVMLIAKAM